jgi:hypothetical protein
MLVAGDMPVPQDPRSPGHANLGFAVALSGSTVLVSQRPSLPPSSRLIARARPACSPAAGITARPQPGDAAMETPFLIPTRRSSRCGWGERRASSTVRPPLQHHLACDRTFPPTDRS